MFAYPWSTITPDPLYQIDRLSQGIQLWARSFNGGESIYVPADIEGGADYLLSFYMRVGLPTKQTRLSKLAVYAFNDLNNPPEDVNGDDLPNFGPTGQIRPGTPELNLGQRILELNYGGSGPPLTWLEYSADFIRMVVPFNLGSDQNFVYVFGEAPTNDDAVFAIDQVELIRNEFNSWHPADVTDVCGPTVIGQDFCQVSDMWFRWYEFSNYSQTLGTNPIITINPTQSGTYCLEWGFGIFDDPNNSLNNIDPNVVRFPPLSFSRCFNVFVDKPDFTYDVSCNGNNEFVVDFERTDAYGNPWQWTFTDPTGNSTTNSNGDQSQIFTTEGLYTFCLSVGACQTCYTENLELPRISEYSTGPYYACNNINQTFQIRDFSNDPTLIWDWQTGLPVNASIS